MSHKKRTNNSQDHQRVATRNWLAIHAFQRGGAGRHKDRKKAANKKACRGRIRA